MKRDFLINIVFLLGINLLIKPVYIFGIDRTVQNLVGEGDYGVYFTLLSLIYMLQAVNDLGIQNFNNRNIAQHRHLLDKFFSNLILLKVFLSIGYGLLLILVAWWLDYTSSQERFILLILWLNQVIISFLLYFRTNISGLGFYRTDSILSALDKLLMIGICGWLILYHRESFRIEWFVVAQTVSVALTALTAFLLVHRQLRLPFRFRWQPALLVVTLRRSLPFALIILLMSIYTRIDAVMLEQISPRGFLENDIYAASYRLLDAFNMVGFLFAGLLLPIFSRMLKEGEPVSDLVRTSAQMLLAGAIALSVSIIFFREEIMQLLYVRATPYWAAVLVPLMLSYIAVCGNYIYGTLLTANGSLRRMNQLFVVGIVVNVVLNLVLIPRYGALGAGTATFITQSAVLIAQIVLAQRLVGLRRSWGMPLRLLALSVLVVLTAYGLHDRSGEQWYWWFGASLLCAVGYALLLRLIDVRDLPAMLRGRA